MTDDTNADDIDGEPTYGQILLVGDGDGNDEDETDGGGDNADGEIVTDGGRDEVAFTTDRGADVAVTADDGVLFVTVDSDDLSFADTRADLRRARGMDVLSCGHQETDSGETIAAMIPVGAHKADVKDLKENSKEIDETPLTYRVEQYTKTSTAGGWGKQEITKQHLVPSKPHGSRTDREQTLSLRIDTDRVPVDAEPGDVLALDDLLDDPRTVEEKDTEALDEAAEAGEEIVVSRTTADCNDPRAECTLDHVTRVATPDGEVETRRTHTY